MMSASTVARLGRQRGLLSSHPCTTALYSFNTAAFTICDEEEFETTPPLLLHEVLPPLDTTTDSRRLYLLRHGETEWNVRGKVQGGTYDIKLNKNGKKQASSVASELSHFPLDMVVSSHLQRAIKTAGAVQTAQQHKNNKEQQIERTSIMSMPEFGEMCFGNYEGIVWRKGLNANQKIREEFFAYKEVMSKNINAKYPGEGSESISGVNERLQYGLQQTLLNYPEKKHIAIVSHARTNTILLASLLYNDPLQYVQFRQANACINVLDVDINGNWKAHVINYKDHIKK